MGRRNVIWDRGKVLEAIADEASKNNGVAISSNVPSRARQCAINEYGSWAKACMAAGVKCPSLGTRSNLSSVNSVEDWHRADVSGEYWLMKPAGRFVLIVPEVVLRLICVVVGMRIWYYRMGRFIVQKI